LKPRADAQEDVLACAKGLRASPHFYNSPEQIQILLDALRRITKLEFTL